MINYIKIIACTTVAVLTTSCSDLLQEEVHTQVSNTYYNTPAGFNAAVNAAYYSLRSFYGTEEGLSATVFGTDTYTEGADGDWKYLNRYNQELDPFDYVHTSLWEDLYQGINVINTVLARAAAGVEGVSEEIATMRSAEVRFIRGHHYFLLVQMFGPVHLTTEETQGVQLEASRAPIDQVYNQIVEDLEFAIANLGLPGEVQYGRATKPAAEHLLARVLLTRGWSDAAQPDDFSRAATLAETVINDYDFRLLDDFGDVYAVGNEQNDEVIWAVQYSENPLANTSTGDNQGNSAHLYFNFPYDQEPGLFRTIEYGRPWRRFRPTLFTTQELFHVDDRDIDSRYKKTFKDVFLTVDPGTYTVDGVEGVELVEGDTALWIPGVEMTLAEQQARNYQVIVPSEYNDINFPPLWKFADPTRPTLNDVSGARDWLAFRLAETHLIAAEAYFMMDGASSPDAVAHLNAVRERAAWPGQEAAMTATTAADLAAGGIDYILDERGRELLGEQFRWFDLVRTGKLVERARAHNPDVVPPLGNLQEFHTLRPIPQSQIDRTAGGEEAFPQNTGY